MLGDDVAVAAADPRAPATGLLPAELAVVARAVEKRRREFAAGRRAARRAMSMLGLPVLPVGMAADRAPVWPSGVVGSIAHTGSICIAVVGRSSKLRSLGIDLEPDEPLEPGLCREICTPAEQAMLATYSERNGGRLARLIFSVKECVYKAQYPLTRAPMNFEDLEVVPDRGAPTCRAKFGRTVGIFQKDASLSVRTGTVCGTLATAVAIPVAGQVLTGSERY
jgi:4'-phosphopantetheinyl transferase EntD